MALILWGCEDPEKLMEFQSSGLLDLQVQDVNTVHTLVASCCAYREFILRRNYFVSAQISPCQHHFCHNCHQLHHQSHHACW